MSVISLPLLYIGCCVRAGRGSTEHRLEVTVPLLRETHAAGHGGFYPGKKMSSGRKVLFVSPLPSRARTASPPGQSLPLLSFFSSLLCSAAQPSLSSGQAATFPFPGLLSLLSRLMAWLRFRGCVLREFQNKTQKPRSLSSPSPPVKPAEHPEGRHRGLRVFGAFGVKETVKWNRLCRSGLGRAGTAPSCFIVFHRRSSVVSRCLQTCRC